MLSRLASARFERRNPVRPERHGGGRGGVEALHDDRGRGPRIPDQLQVLPACGARDETRIVSLDLLAAQRRQCAFGSGDLQGIAGRIP
ncbi:MAG: hypothetical protein DMD40_02385 [Gemmatimonadetes bacterium]|nr:MAG: hypothetical protein DMD40_02385 [Gemmatimonadota bacterium]